MTAGEYPEVHLRLPFHGPVARGRLLAEAGSDGRPSFVILAGSPARKTVTPSFRDPAKTFREKLIEDGVIVASTTWPGYLETTRDITCNSPSRAAAVLTGNSANGWHAWKSADGRKLGDLLQRPASGWSRTWLVRGSNVSGMDLVQRLWLPEGRVSLAARRLRPGVAPGIGKDQVRTFVEEDYGSAATFARRREMVDEFHDFLSRMRPGDTVCAISNGNLYVGEITGEAEQVASDDGRSNLRRPVEWQGVGYPYDELPEELQQKLSIQHDVVDLTSVEALVAGLGRSDEELPEPTEGLRKELLVPELAWLREVRDLLWDERQLIFYGPPGTGKTYLALKLAEFLGGGPEQVKLVQFHPSYAYEDFFQGFRPQEDTKTGEVAFRLTDGPLYELADLASREGNRHVPHFLVIDEINRANLAKVFGELYFLLEYRNRSVRLTYSGDDFALPPNVFVIGTMNTADRSIALVDAAMRRRFAFVELSPRVEPTRGLLRRWLVAQGRDPEPADLLDALNARIDDPDFQIGPSYLMKKGAYREGGLERAWRTKILPLLAEYHYGEEVDVERRYGLGSLRAAIGRPPQTGAPGTP